MTPPETDHSALALCVAGMAIVTALPRILPITFLAHRKLPPALMRWLSFVPVSVLAALLAPEVFLRNGELHLAADNFFLLSAYSAGRMAHTQFFRGCNGRHGDRHASPSAVSSV